MTTIDKNMVILGLFFFILGAIATLVSVLLPYRLSMILLFLLLILGWVIYDKYIVAMMGWKYIWWSPHVRRLNIKPSFIKKVDPEILLILYFINNNFKSYSKYPLKEGFVMRGVDKQEGAITATYEKKDLEIKFFPMFSKKSVKLMKDFEKFLSKYHH
jgi:hypothetical protein